MVSKRPRHVLHGGSRTRFRGAELEPGKEHPGRQHRAVGLGPAPSMSVPCLGRSSAPGRPPAAAHPGGSQTSPGWTARSSRSPGCHQSCARGCRCLPAGCSSPGFGGRQKVPGQRHALWPRDHLGARETQQGTQKVGRGKRSSFERAQDEEGPQREHVSSGAAQASPPGVLLAGNLPFPLMPAGTKPRV